MTRTTKATDEYLTWFESFDEDFKGRVTASLSKVVRFGRADREIDLKGNVRAIDRQRESTGRWYRIYYSVTPTVVLLLLGGGRGNKIEDLDRAKKLLSG